MSSYVGNRSNNPIIDFMLDTIEDRGHDAAVIDAAVERWNEDNGEDDFWTSVLGPAIDTLEAQLGLASEIESVTGRNPTCDLCGKAQQPEDDWNGETGNHVVCEQAEAWGNLQRRQHEVD